MLLQARKFSLGLKINSDFIAKIPRKHRLLEKIPETESTIKQVDLCESSKRLQIKNS